MKPWNSTSLPLRGQDRVSDIAAEFHEHTKWTIFNMPVESLRIESVLSDVAKSGKFRQHGKSYFAKNEISLDSLLLDGTIQDALDQRKSGRDLSEEPLTDAVLSKILLPICERDPDALISSSIGRRAFPSAGGLFPIEAYVVRRSFDDISGESFSVYHVDARRKCLDELRSHVARSEVSNSLGAARPAKLPTFGAAIILTSVFGRSTCKYGLRGYRFALLEAGHLAQNLLLACSAIDLDCYCYGGYMDNPTGDLLGIDGVEEAPIHCILCGGSSDSAIAGANEMVEV